MQYSTVQLFLAEAVSYRTVGGVSHIRMLTGGSEHMHRPSNRQPLACIPCHNVLEVGQVGVDVNALAELGQAAQPPVVVLG